MHITFLRSLSSEQVDTFITDYIQNNLTDVEKNTFADDLNKISTAISGESAIYAGKDISIVGDVARNNIYYVNSAGGSTMIHSQNTGFVLKVFSIWFGEPNDNDAWNLKQGLLNPPNVSGVN